MTSFVVVCMVVSACNMGIANILVIDFKDDMTSIAGGIALMLGVYLILAFDQHFRGYYMDVGCLSQYCMWTCMGVGYCPNNAGGIACMIGCLSQHV